MSKTNKRFFLSLIYFVLVSVYGIRVAFPNQVYALKFVGNGSPPGYLCENMTDVFTYGFKCLEGVAYNLVSASIYLIALAFFVGLIAGGIKYITAGGDEKAIMSARKTLTYTVLGLVIGVTAYYLLKLLGETLGLPGLIFFYIPCRSGLGC